MEIQARQLHILQVVLRLLRTRLVQHLSLLVHLDHPQQPPVNLVLIHQQLVHLDQVLLDQALQLELQVLQEAFLQLPMRKQKSPIATNSLDVKIVKTMLDAYSVLTNRSAIQNYLHLPLVTNKMV
jgi:hypothetical protein